MLNMGNVITQSRHSSGPVPAASPGFMSRQVHSDEILWLDVTGRLQLEAPLWAAQLRCYKCHRYMRVKLQRSKEKQAWRGAGRQTTNSNAVHFTWITSEEGIDIKSTSAYCNLSLGCCPTI